MFDKFIDWYLALRKNDQQAVDIAKNAGYYYKEGLIYDMQTNKVVSLKDIKDKFNNYLINNN